MARRRVGYHVTRPGRREDDPPVEIPIAADLKSVPGTPTRDVEVSYYSREYPLESVAVEHSASSLWALDVREEAAPETAELYREHQKEIGPIVEWLKSTGDMEPTARPSGDDVTEAIRAGRASSDMARSDSPTSTAGTSTRASASTFAAT